MTDFTTTSSASADAASAKDKAADVANTGKQAASDVAGTGKQAAGDVAATATDAAKDVAAETKKQASDLVGNTRQQLTEQAANQQTALVGTLRDLGDQLAAMTDDVDQHGTAVDLASQARDRARTTADWLDGRSPAEVVDELRNLGRRRPGAFLLGSLVAGVVAGRLTRGVVDVHTDPTDDSAAASSEPAKHLDTTAAVPVLPAGTPNTGRHEAPRRVSPNGSGAL